MISGVEQHDDAVQASEAEMDQEFTRLADASGRHNAGAQESRTERRKIILELRDSDSPSRDAPVAMYPLPLYDLEILDDAYNKVSVTIGPSRLYDGVNTCITFSLTCSLVQGDISELLFRRARALGVGIEELPSLCDRPLNSEERRAMHKAKVAVRDALFYTILRFANLKEVRSKFRAPARISLAGSSYEASYKQIDPSGESWNVLYPNGLADLFEVVSDPEKREAGRASLRGNDLVAFDQYCAAWDEVNGELVASGEE